MSRMSRWTASPMINVGIPSESHDGVPVAFEVVALPILYLNRGEV